MMGGFMEDILGGGVVLLLMFLFLYVPLIITAMNLYYIFAKPGKLKLVAETLTWTLGPLFTAILCDFIGIGGDWQEQLYVSEYGSRMPVTGNFVVMVLILFSLGILGYILLKLASKRLPPPVKIISILFLFIGCMICALWIVRIVGRVEEFRYYLILFPLNLILLSVSLVRTIMREQKDEDEGKEI